MLRRGLHGAARWVNEPENPGGTPRSGPSKLARAVVVLIPLWIVVSAATGGPERGGHSTSFWSTAMLTVLSTIAILGYFSARERSQGREEPWNLPSATKSDDASAETRVQPGSEAPTEVVESPQVSEPDFSEGVVTPSYIPDVSDQTPQVPFGVATDVATEVFPAGREEVSRSPFVQARTREGVSLGKGGHLVDGVATPQKNGVTNHPNPGALRGDTPTVRLDSKDGGGHPASVSLQKASNPQVSAQMSLVTEGSEEQSSGIWDSVTARDDDTASANTLSLVTRIPEEPLNAQVGASFGVATQLTMPVLAEAGPYPTEEDPVAEDWWAIKPDVDTEEEPEEPGPNEDVAVETAEALPVAEAPEAPLQEDGGESEAYPPGRHPAVVLYLAMKSMPGATDEEREEARLGAVAWAKSGIKAGHLSQRSAAAALGVSKTTIGNWLERGEGEPYDPFDIAEGE